MTDNTDKTTNQRITELESLLKDAVEAKDLAEGALMNLGDGVIIQDLNYRVLFENTVQQRMVGENAGKYCYVAYEGIDQLCDNCPMVLSLKDGGIHKMEKSIQTPQGDRHFELTTSPLKDASGKFIGGLKLVRDITDKVKAEKDMKIKDAAIASSINAIGIADINGRLTYVNDALLRQCGHTSPDSLLGHHVLEYWEDREKAIKVLDALRKDGRWSGEMRALRADGTAFDTRLSANIVFDHKGTPLCMMASFIDITEEKLFEEQLRHVNKMEALGTLSSGIAHEFNNIMTIIMGHATLIEEELAEDSKHRKYLEAILIAANRASTLTRSLLVYTNKQITVKELHDFNKLISHTVEILKHLLPENISLSVNICNKPLSILADRAQIEQAITNITTNAIDAMPDGGTIEIRTDELVLEQVLLDHQSRVPAGQYALLTVSDNGMGIETDRLSRIFEPFYTTKDIGKGTGLGLSVVYGIAEKHNGYVAIESKPDEGATIRMYFPLNTQS